MSKTSIATEVLRHFPDVVPTHVAGLGNAGGFSGAFLWKITTSAGRTLCLRRWPQAHPPQVVLQELHQLLRHAAGQGLSVLPVPLPHRGGDSVVNLHQALYELTPWLPGQADFHDNPTRPRLSNALALLARFHATTLPSASDMQVARSAPPLKGVSPGILERSAKLAKLQAGEFDRLRNAVAGHSDAAIRDRGQRLLSLFPLCADQARERLNLAAHVEVAMQPCIRDVWHDHLLFSGDEVTGLIDFGAMRVDNIACDIARLTGSLVRDDRAAWSAALNAYQTVRPLTANENLLIDAFDQSSVLMSGISWLEWICLEGRRFGDPRRVHARLDENLQRLEQLARS